MHVLFVHKNYPAQFGHIAAHLAAREGFECTFVSERPEGHSGGVRRLQYKLRGGAKPDNHYCSRSFEDYTWHSHAVYETMKAHPEVRPDLVARLPLPREYPDTDRVVVFFGALNREQDWRPIMPAINEVAARCGDRLHFKVLHDRAFFDALEAEHKDYEPWSPYQRFLEVLRTCDIGLLPLLDNRVNRMKSDLKFLEHSAHGVAVLASPVVYEDTIVDGVTGLICRSPHDYRDRLLELVDHPDRRRQLASAAYHHVREHRLLVQHFRHRHQWYAAMHAQRPHLTRQLVQRIPELKP